jgi:hypothetical protein
MNNFLKKITSLLFCVGVLSLCRAGDEVLVEVAPSIESSLVDAPVSLGSSVSEELVNFKADRPDFSSDNKAFAAVVDKELESLRRRYGSISPTVVSVCSRRCRNSGESCSD